MTSEFIYVVEIMLICRVFEYFIHSCIYELMTWLIEVYAIFPLWCFIVKIFMHVNWEFIEDVTFIYWIFIIFTLFIALIEVGRYKLVLEHGYRAVKTGRAVQASPFSPINFRAWALNIEPEF